MKRNQIQWRGFSLLSRSNPLLHLVVVTGTLVTLSTPTGLPSPSVSGYIDSESIFRRCSLAAKVHSVRVTTPHPVNLLDKGQRLVSISTFRFAQSCRRGRHHACVGSSFVFTLKVAERIHCNPISRGLYSRKGQPSF